MQAETWRPAKQRSNRGRLALAFPPLLSPRSMVGYEVKEANEAHHGRGVTRRTLTRTRSKRRGTPSGVSMGLDARASRCWIFSRMMMVTRPPFRARSSSTHACAASVVPTTRLSSAGQAVVMAQSYASYKDVMQRVLGERNPRITVVSLTINSEQPWHPTPALFPLPLVIRSIHPIPLPPSSTRARVHAHQ